MLNLSEYRQHTAQLADYLPWGFLVAPGVVLNKDGSFQKTLSYRGPDVESVTPEELTSLTARVNNLLKRFGSGWVMFFEAARMPALNYPADPAASSESGWPSKAAWLIDEERRARFSEETRFFESRYYASFLWQPPEDRANRLEGLMIERPGSKEDAKENSWRDHLEQFQTDVQRAVDMLRGIMPEVHELDDDETLTYLHQAVSGNRHYVKSPETGAYLDCLLSDEPLVCGLEPKLGDQHLRVLSVQGLPPASEPGLLDALNRLGFSYRWVTRFISLDKTKAQQTLEKTRRHWFAKRKSVLSLLRETVFQEASQLIDSDAENKAIETNQALQDLGSDAVAFGYATTTIIVSDTDPVLATQKLQAVAQIFNARGFVTITETVNAVEAWMGSLPGQPYANVRQPLIHTLNLAHLSPISSVWAGPTRNEHLDAPALMQVATDGTTPFRLVTHQGDVGHTLVVGPTGAGKSVLLSLIAAQFTRYEEPQVFFFDKGASARAAILSMKGSWSDLGLNEKSAFQPLRHIDNPAELAWALDWLLVLIADEGLEVTPDQKQALWSALQNLSTVPAADRTLTGLSLLLQDADIKQALHPFTLEGAFGAVLDSEEESLSLTALHGFEMEDLMQTERLVLPVLTYLFHRIEAKFDGRPTLLVLDEAWVFLDHPVFAARIREWLKTLRKKNVSVIFATQSLADIAGSAIAPALIESCPSRIFLPNAKAHEPVSRRAYEGFGLNDRQISLISEAIPKRQYYFSSPGGNRLFDLDIGEVGLAFCAASSREDQRQITEILEGHGREAFADQWLRSKGLDWAASLSDQSQGEIS